MKRAENREALRKTEVIKWQTRKCLPFYHATQLYRIMTTRLEETVQN